MALDFQTHRAEFAKFGEHYEQTLSPLLQSWEGERKTRLTVGIILAIAMLPIGLVLAWYFGLVHDGGDSRAFHIAYVLPACAYILAMFGLRKRVKQQLIDAMCGFVGWDHSCGGDGKEIAQTLYDFDVLPEYNYVRINDVMQGFHEYWPFTLQEMTLIKKEGFGRNQHYTTVFRGIVLSFAVRSTITGEAVITRCSHSGHPRNKPGIRHEGVVDSANGRITIRASNERMLRTILCERFQSALIELDAKVPTIDLACVMHNQELHIPITTKDLFEVDWLFDKMDSKLRVQRMLDEFCNVLDVLDVFLKPRACRTTGTLKVPEFRYLTPQDHH